MFSFTQLCEYYTRNGNSWFYFSERLLSCVADKGDIEVEPVDGDLIRVFFPSARRFVGLDREAINKLLAQAVESNDWNRVKLLKSYIK